MIQIFKVIVIHKILLQFCISCYIKGSLMFHHFNNKFGSYQTTEYMKYIIIQIKLSILTLLLWYSFLLKIVNIFEVSFQTVVSFYDFNLIENRKYILKSKFYIFCMLWEN